MNIQKHHHEIQGREVLQEAVHYLERMRFSTTRGDSAEGKHVSIRIAPRLHEDQKLSVLITCRAFGHRKVDWDRLAVWVPDPAQGTIALGARFNDRGQKFLPPLPPGEYALQVGTCADKEILIRPPANLPQGPKKAVGFQGVRTRGSTGSQKATDRGVELSGPQVVASVDGTITATVRPTASEVEVAFETHEPDLDKRQIAFAFTHPDTGRVELSGVVPLVPAPDDPKVLEGVWTGPASFSKPCRFVFRLVPEGTIVSGTGISDRKEEPQ